MHCNEHSTNTEHVRMCTDFEQQNQNVLWPIVQNRIKTNGSNDYSINQLFVCNRQDDRSSSTYCVQSFTRNATEQTDAFD